MINVGLDSGVVAESVPSRSKRNSFAAIRPRFLQELVVVPMEDKLIVQGSTQVRVFHGAAARSLLPDLIGLMDGNRSVQELQALFPTVPAEHVRDAISLLYSCRLVEDGISDHVDGIVSNKEALAFFRRMSTHGSMCQSGAEAVERLRASRIIIVNSQATKEHDESLQRLLEKTGIGRVIVLDQESLKNSGTLAEPWSGQSLLVTQSFGSEDCAWHAQVDDWSFAHGLPWFRVVVDVSSSYADLGPLFNGEETPCYRCFSSIHSVQNHSDSCPSPPASRTSLYYWHSLVAIEVIYLISRVGPLLAGRDFRRYNLQDWSTEHLQCARVSGCLRCRPQESENAADRMFPTEGTPIDTALIFDDYVGAQSRHTAAPAEHTPQFIAALISQVKRLPNCNRLDLNANVPKLERGVLDILSAKPEISSNPLNLDELASILMMTAGIRSWSAGDKQIQRWAATAGNLGSVELFLAIRQVEGLSPGFYFYQPRDHSLASFQRRSGMLEIDEFIRRVVASSPDQLPDALVLFTGAYHRLAQKYGPFAYRLVNFDAGAAVAQLCAVAGGLNISAKTATVWADDLIEEQLNLEPLDEQSTAVVCLSRDMTGRPEFVLPGNDLKRKPYVSSLPKSTKRFCGLSKQKLVEMVYRESRVKECEIQRTSSIVLAPRGTMNERPVTALLPPAARGGRLLGEVLSERRSVRRHTAYPVSLSQLSSMLGCAHHGDEVDWPEEHAEGRPLTFMILAFAVEGLESGVYTYDRHHHGLLFMRTAPTPKDTIELFLQPDFSSAPLICWMVGNLRKACAARGAFGHRQLLLRAGAAANRLWMASLGMGLLGCLVAGVVPGAARKQLGLDGYERAGLLAFATGHGPRPLR
jgi:SagB-type dehydrogenase family enzyme